MEKKRILTSSLQAPPVLVKVMVCYNYTIVFLRSLHRLGVVGRDYYGVYPLKGKLLNVREASPKQIKENQEISDLVKIIGLEYGKKYESVEDIGKNLRYGKVMIMTDQDQDGSHIKGLVINFIHHNWPSLLKLPFLEEFITPIVKVSRHF